MVNEIKCYFPFLKFPLGFRQSLLFLSLQIKLKSFGIYLLGLDLSFTYINILLVCLSVMVSFRLYPINFMRLNRAGPNFLGGPQGSFMDAQNYKIFSLSHNLLSLSHNLLPSTTSNSLSQTRSNQLTRLYYGGKSSSTNMNITYRFLDLYKAGVSSGLDLKLHLWSRDGQEFFSFTCLPGHRHKETYSSTYIYIYL